MAIANITVSVTEPVITVSSDLANVSVTSPISNIVVGTAVVVSDADVRTKISVQNMSGYGSLAYDNSASSNGIIQYTGVSNAEVIGTLTGGNGIDVDSSGVIAIDADQTTPYDNYVSFSSGKLRINGVTNTVAETLVARDSAGDIAASNITLGNYIQPGGGLQIGNHVNMNALGEIHNRNGNVNVFGEDNIILDIDTGSTFGTSRYFQVKNQDGELITALQPANSPTGKTVRIGNTAGDGLLQAGNITTVNDITASGNVSGTYILGDGSLLTGIDSNVDVKAYIESTGLDMTANITSTNPISTSLDMTARYFKGSGELLTGMDALIISTVNDNGLALQYNPSTGIANNPPIFRVKGAATFEPQPDDIANSSVIFTTDIEIGASQKIGPQLASGDINFGVGNIVLNKGQTAGTDATISVDNSYDTNIEDAWIRYDDSIDKWQIKGSGTFGGTNDNIVDQFALTSQLNPVVHTWNATDLAADIKQFIVSDTSMLNTSSPQSNLQLTHNFASASSLAGFEMTRTNMQGLPPGGTNVGANKLYLYAGPAYDADGSLEHYNHMDVDGAVRAYSNVFAQTGGVEANLDITSISGNISGVGMVTTGNATVGGNLNVAGDLEVTGNINYREVTDLLVQDQTITLNFGNASAQDAQIIVDRQGSGVANVDLKWNETTDRWQFTNDGSTYYDLATSTSDIAEGTNLYYTDARVGTAVASLTSNVTTTANVSGSYILGDISQATGVDYLTNAQVKTYIETNGLDATANLTTTANISGNYLLGNINATSGGFGDINYLNLPQTGSSILTDGKRGTIYAQPVPWSGTAYTPRATPVPNVAGTRSTETGIRVFMPEHNSGHDAELSGNLLPIISVHNEDTVNTQDRNATWGLYYQWSNSSVSGNLVIAPQSSGQSYNDYKFVVDSQSEFIGDLTVAAETVGAGIGSSGSVTAAENLVAGNNVTATGNVSGAYILGDGSQLTNLPTQANLDTGNVYVGNANVTVQVTPSTNFVTQVTTSGSTTFAIESITPFQNGSVNVDAVTFVGGQIYSDGLQVVISGVTASGATALNGLTFYLKWTNGDGGVYELYDNVGLTTASQRATGSYINPTNGIITYSAGTTITPTFALADTVTVANVQLTNELQSSAGANLNINSNTKSVVFKKDFLSATDTAQIELDPEGWSVTNIDYPNGTPPVYSGSAERVAWIIEGTATAGSKVINVTTAEEWGLAYGTNNFNGTAPSTAGRTSMFTGSNPIANNYVSRTKGSTAVGQTPFPSGSIIESFDSAANTITMSQAADVDATFAWNGGGNGQTLYTLVSGAYNNDVGVTFGYYSNYDYDQLGAPNNSKVTLNYAEVNSYDKYGFGPTGPSASDLQYSIGTSSDYTKPSYGTRGRMALNGEKSFLNTNYGMNIGEGAVTNRIVADQFTGYGISQLWDGTLDYNTLFGSSSLIPQIGYRQFTDGIAQNGSPHLGPRFQFMSSKGNVNDPSTEWYPRTGQEIGRMGFWGSHGDVPNASSTAQPAYISVQAADDWATGSNASVYHVGTSDYSSQYRMPFMSFEKGNLILAAGIANGAQESVHFAPGRGVTNNPANVYDFNAGPSGTTGWASINYENVGGQTGAELSVNNGGSLGVGNVGDMAIGLHRKDNTYTATVSSTSRNGLIYNGPGSGASGDIFDFQNNPPLIGLPDATPVVASGFTNYFAPINGQTLYTLKVFGGQFIVLYEDVGLTIPVQYLPAGVGATSDPGSLTYSTSAASGVTDKEWTFSLAEQSEDLVLKGNTTTQVTFTDSRTDLNSSLKLKSYTTTEVNALPSPQAGDTVFCTDASGGATIVFHNGTSWQKVSHANL